MKANRRYQIAFFALGWLIAIGLLFQIGLGTGFQALYDQIKMKALGHLAGGVHRNGKDFFNLYYGVTGLPHFHEGFR